MPESENTETPPVEIPEIAKTPDKAPEISAPDPATYKKKLDQLYWLRIIFAAASGIIATFAFDSIDGEERRWASIIFMIAVYLVTFVIAKSMKMQLPASDKKKIILGEYHMRCKRRNMIAPYDNVSEVLYLLSGFLLDRSLYFG